MYLNVDCSFDRYYRLVYPSRNDREIEIRGDDDDAVAMMMLDFVSVNDGDDGMNQICLEEKIQFHCPCY